MSSTDTAEFVRRLKNGADELERAARAAEEDVTRIDVTSAVIPVPALRRIAASFTEAADIIERQAAEIVQLCVENDNIAARTGRGVSNGQ